MNKLEMAHDYAKISLTAMLNDDPESDINFEILAMNAFDFAEAMQAEADKRKNVGLPKHLFKRMSEAAQGEEE